MSISKTRQNVWLLVVVFFVIGDLVTTFFGMATPGIVEQNTIASDWFNNNQWYNLLGFKFAMVIVAYALDLYFVRELQDWALPIIPVALTLLGVYAVVNNIMVLSNLGVSPIGVSVFLILPSLMFISYIRKKFGYTI